MPASRSLVVSPTTATSATSSISQPQYGGEDHVGPRVGPGRRHPVNRARSMAPSPPSEAMMRSRVAGENPVVRQIRMPAWRSAAKSVDSAPGTAATSPRSTAWSKATSKAASARSARWWSPPSSSVNTADLGLPHRPSHAGPRVVVEVIGNQVYGIEGLLEGLLDGAVVGDGGARHVQDSQPEGQGSCLVLDPAGWVGRRGVAGSGASRSGDPASQRPLPLPGHHRRSREVISVDRSE